MILLENWKNWILERRIYFLVLGGVFVINLILYLGVTRSSRAKLDTVSQSLQASQSRLREKQKEYKEKYSHAKELERMEKRIDFVYHSVLMTREEHFAKIRMEIEDLFDKFRVEDTSKSYYWTPIPKEEVTRCTLSIPLKGSYENLRQFVESVEKSNYMIIIDRINLAESSETGQELNLSIGLSTYFYDPQSEGNAVKS
jgi:Tfp pilus assembly protein PilO